MKKKGLQIRHILQGSPSPLGSNWDGKGVNFALFSRYAEKVELCLFDDTGKEQLETIPMHWKTGSIWHCYLPGIGPGIIYGYRVYGPYDPKAGHRFNPNKILLDPYAKDIEGSFIWNEALYGYDFNHELGDLSFCHKDNAAFVPKSKVVANSQMEYPVKRPEIPMDETVIYETHVKGLTAQNLDIPEKLRGTFMGMCHPSVIEYLKDLGVTTVELLPVFLLGEQFFLKERELKNYWGYDPISYFVLNPVYGIEDIRSEFRYMVETYHAEGLEIILDVVYNHTGEHAQMGPTYSFRGIDNRSYYALIPENRRYYQNDTGCGNVFNLANLRVNQLVMDSLRYFVKEMRVDGFRFDLAVSLIRDGYGNISPSPNFFAAIQQDPILNSVKLIAEPWDLGKNGWQTGRFSNIFSEWNDRFRENVRKFWNSDGTAAGFASAFAGSSEMFNHFGRRPQASINFITAHDGFTLKDLVSYNHKHNEDNKEGNHDGTDHNISNNYGAEGETNDAQIQQLRWQQMRNFMVSLIFSQGVPMITAGDEYGRTQKGNNNAWCQDNPISWLRWDKNETELEFFAFVKKLLHFRKSHPVFRRIHFFDGRSDVIPETKDIVWLSSSGFEMQSHQWQGCKCFGAFFPGDTGLYDPFSGKPLLDDRFLFLFNSHHEDHLFKLPQGLEDRKWNNVFDTSILHDNNNAHDFSLGAGEYLLKAYSVALWRELKNNKPSHLHMREKG